MTKLLDEFTERLRRLVTERLDAQGLYEDSDPVVVQAALDRIQAEVNESIAHMGQGFTFTLDSEMTIVVGLREVDS